MREIIEDGEAMLKITPFDIGKHHIRVRMVVLSRLGSKHFLNAILDTGAPRTEISDRSLILAGFPFEMKDVVPGKFQQTRKYAKVRLKNAKLLGQTLEDWVVHISKFDESWGIDALIGLDFFRQFEVRVNYKKREIATLRLAA